MQRLLNGEVKIESYKENWSQRKLRERETLITIRRGTLTQKKEVLYHTEELPGGVQKADRYVLSKWHA